MTAAAQLHLFAPPTPEPARTVTASHPPRERLCASVRVPSALNERRPAMWAGEGKARAGDSTGSPAHHAVTTERDGRATLESYPSPTKERPGDPGGGALVMPREIRTEPGRGCTPALSPPALGHGCASGGREPGASERDAALALHAVRRRELIAIADVVALELAARDGTVTSTAVRAEMERRGHGPRMAPHDPRWMGAVLLPSRGWTRCAEVERSGSKCRPVAVWRRT